jgi:Asp-tRNA(Asn)/Glu-tRNA(Gln) amidotransferase A subunit family amidase
MDAVEDRDRMPMAHRVGSSIVGKHSSATNGSIASPTGFPSITVPIGYAQDFLPAGLELLGLPGSEPTLFRLGCSYEQTMHHRRSPVSVPPLKPTQ